MSEREKKNIKIQQPFLVPVIIVLYMSGIRPFVGKNNNNRKANGLLIRNGSAPRRTQHDFWGEAGSGWIHIYECEALLTNALMYIWPIGAFSTSPGICDANLILGHKMQKIRRETFKCNARLS